MANKKNKTKQPAQKAQAATDARNKNIMNRLQFGIVVLSAVMTVGITVGNFLGLEKQVDTLSRDTDKKIDAALLKIDKLTDDVHEQTLVLTAKEAELRGKVELLINSK